MPIWQRLLITLALMLITSFAAGILWHAVFNTDIPGYLSGAVGGVTAIPAWEFLKRVGPKRERKDKSNPL
jgi:hypothetical protein